MTPADRLANIGRALYGDRWRAQLARDLGINELTIRRWLSGHTPLPEDHGVFAKAAAILDKRAATMQQLRDDMAWHPCK